MKKLLLFVLTIHCSLVTIHCISQSCLPDSIIFTTQTQIDSFQINYPNCSEIEGNVTIIGDDLINLHGLSVLTSIGGDFHFLSHSSTLTNLTGLDALTSIEGDFIFSWFSSPLTNLTGLDSLTYIGGNFQFVCANTTLTNLMELNSLTSIGGDFYFNCSNTPLTNLEGLGALTSIGKEFHLSGSCLNSLTGLNSLTSIGGDVTLYHQYSLPDYTGLEALTSIGGSINVWGSRLVDLTGLSSLTSLGGLDLGGNVHLASLSGLETLTTISGSIIILSCDSLNSLSALENITSIGGRLTFDRNNGLTSLTGLENIDPFSIDSLSIIFNDNLATCEVKSICDYLVNPVGSIEIHDNAAGCNSSMEVDTACAQLSIPDINFESNVLIYPNPADDILTISCKNETTIEEVVIYNQLGSRVFERELPNSTINLSNLKQGIYIIEFTSKKMKSRQKLIIKE